MNRAPLADAPPIPRAELHRDRVSFSRVAERKYPGAGWAVHQWWRRFNETLFGRQMRPCRIQFGASFEDRFGLWRREDPAIILSRSLLRQDGERWWLRHETLGSRFPLDVLLRQMTCQYIETVREAPMGDDLSIERLPDTRGWIREINRLTEEMASMGMASMGMTPMGMGSMDKTSMEKTSSETDGENRQARPSYLATDKSSSAGALTRPEVAWWPYSIRPSGYYDADWTPIVGT